MDTEQWPWLLEAREPHPPQGRVTQGHCLWHAMLTVLGVCLTRVGLAEAVQVAH